MKVYITKWALTTGILEIEGREVDNGYCVIKLSSDHMEQCIQPGDWHRSIDAATVRARELKARKIINLTRQLERLKKLDIQLVKGGGKA
jgi:hypothetical protein